MEAKVILKKSKVFISHPSTKYIYCVKQKKDGRFYITCNKGVVTAYEDWGLISLCQAIKQSKEYIAQIISFETMPKRIKKMLYE